MTCTIPVTFTIQVGAPVSAGGGDTGAGPGGAALAQLESDNILDGIAVLHWTGQHGFSLGFGHGLTNPGTGPQMLQNRLAYTHVTGPGASGAPVFDTSSGKVVCLHVAGNTRVTPAVGYCTPISKVVAAMNRK